VTTPAPRRLSQPEAYIAHAISSMKSRRDVFPIADPDLSAISELLHRMTVCQEDTPATRMAGEAIRRLRAYLMKAGTQR
jgi:hypothetical protein